jgi:hypothetical protein
LESSDGQLLSFQPRLLAAAAATAKIMAKTLGSAKALLLLLPVVMLLMDMARLTLLKPMQAE